MIITKQYTIQGKVHHVGYRAHVKKAADKLSITGVANHAPDNAIVVIAQGEEESFPEFEKALRLGPVMAFVRKLNAKLLNTKTYFRSFQVEGIVLSRELSGAIEKALQEANL